MQGEIQLWDVGESKLIHAYNDHMARVGALTWYDDSLFASGSRDRSIVCRDPRVFTRQRTSLLEEEPRFDSTISMKFTGHRSEICGLKWNYGDQPYLASGGNDTQVMIWSPRFGVGAMRSSNSIEGSSVKPLHTYTEHSAAVKALSWCPHKPAVLATGGGTNDRTIRLWNTNVSGAASFQALDTGSQVCCMHWSQLANELVTTHGFSQNLITVWQCPELNPLATLAGHTYRVLYMAVSPDGSTIVTGSGDQTLRFWNLFPAPSSVRKSRSLGRIDVTGQLNQLR